MKPTSRVPAITFLGILLFSLVAMAPGVVAGVADCTASDSEPDPIDDSLNYLETFENDTLFQPPTGCFYTLATAGAVSVQNDQAYNSTRSLRVSSSGEFSFTWTDSMLACSTDNPGDTSVTNFAVRFDDFTTGGATFGYRAGTVNTNRAEIDFATDGSITLKVEGGSGSDVTLVIASAGFVVEDRWYVAELFVHCVPSPTPLYGASASVTDTVTEQTVGDFLAAPVAFSTPASWAIFNSFTTGSGTIWIDDVGFQGPFPAEAGSRFCANPALEPGEDGSVDYFGYEYVEDVAYSSDIQTAGISLQDGFFFQGGVGDQGFLGKGFTSGSTSFRTEFRIEAASEGSDSQVSIAYTTGGATPGTTLPSVSTKGDGEDGGNFDDNVQARFREDGNEWQVSIRANVAGAGLEVIGAAVSLGSPNSAQTYKFVVDSLATTAWVEDSEGEIILIRNLPAGLQNEVFFDQWFVFEGDNGALSLSPDAYTALDDTDQGQEDSTCIFDLVGTSVVANSAGLEPGSMFEPPASEEDPASTCESVFCVDATNVPEGFTAAAINGFLGLVLVMMIGVGGVGAIASQNPGFRVSGLVIGIFSLIGYLMALYFGLLPLWPLVVVAIAGAGIVFARFKASG